ncbi:5'-3' exonuclease H3TH domain-containing protein, partial [Streptomyces malaysiensis]|uniref:5'-3' exonuclease H3TH domain-containing protein n=1 Tax=Streptomyces malaysiensis TaxID=92644 RepID=UPI0031FDF42D
KGVPGIGPKGAKALLQQFGNLARLLASPPASKEEHSVHRHKHEALLARQLVRLVDDIELGFNLKDLRYRPSTKGP